MYNNSMMYDSININFTDVFLPRNYFSTVNLSICLAHVFRTLSNISMKEIFCNFIRYVILQTKQYERENYLSAIVFPISECKRLVVSYFYF